MLMHVHLGGDHSHDHIHDHRDIKPLKIAITLTSLILVLQIVGGIVSNSLALLSDAGHVFVDLASLLIAYFGLRIAKRAREHHDIRYTYGLRRIEILAAMTNGFLLVGICIYIGIEAVKRFIDSSDGHVHADSMLWVAIIGFVANGISALYLHSSEHITTRSAYLHVLTDLASSGGVIVAAIVIKMTGYDWVDPAISLMIALLILRGAFSVIKQSGTILMESAPENIDPKAVQTELASMDGILSVHDVHIWQLSQDDVKASVHVVTNLPNDSVVVAVKERLQEKYNISHTTVQVETENMDDDCGGC